MARSRGEPIRDLDFLIWTGSIVGLLLVYFMASRGLAGYQQGGEFDPEGMVAALPDRVVIWTGWEEGSPAWLLTGFHEEPDRARFDREWIGEALGGGDRGLGVAFLWVYGFGGSESIEIDRRDLGVRVERVGGGWLEEELLDRLPTLPGEKPRHVEVPLAALSGIPLRESGFGPFQVDLPPGHARRFLLLFGEDFGMTDLASVEIRFEDRPGLSLERNELSRRELTRYLEEPSGGRFPGPAGGGS